VDGLGLEVGLLPVKFEIVLFAETLERHVEVGDFQFVVKGAGGVVVKGLGSKFAVVVVVMGNMERRAQPIP